MPSTTMTNTDDRALSSDPDVDFAIGAARYLRNAGLSDADITTSLVDELGIDLTDAQRITLTLSSHG